MSLLNEMLKDLDKKRPYQPANLLIPPLKRNWGQTFPPLFYGLTTLVMLSCVIFVVTYKSWHTQPVIPPLSEPEPVAVKTVEPAVLLSNIPPIPTLASHLTEEALASNPFLEEPEPPQDPVQKKMARLTPEEWHDEHLNKALEAMEDGNNQRAIDLLELVLTEFPASIEARESLAAIYLSYEEMDKAEEILNTGLTFEPHNLRLTTMKSRLLVALGQHRAALALLEQFKPEISKSPDYYGVLAAVFEALGRTTEAGSLYQSLVKIEPLNGQYWLGYGIALENKHATQQAIDAYQRASQSESSQPAVRSYAETRLNILQG